MDFYVWNKPHDDDDDDDDDTYTRLKNMWMKKNVYIAYHNLALARCLLITWFVNGLGDEMMMTVNLCTHAEMHQRHNCEQLTPYIEFTVFCVK